MGFSCPLDKTPNSAIYLKIDMPAEKVGKKYRTNFIEPGIISYEDVDMGIVFVGQPALDRMRKTFIGKPIVTEAHYDPENGQEFEIGVVTDVGHDDGWDWADLMIFDEETRQRIDIQDYGVSCAYVPTQTAGNGKYHGIEFDAEVLDGEYTHMAIVDSPRYEGSLIYLNSKKEKVVRKFKLITGKKKLDKEPDKKPEKPVIENAEGDVENAAEDIDMENAYVELDNGDRVPLSDLVAAHKDRGYMMNMDDEIDVDGKKVKVSDMYDAYTSMGDHKNAEPPTDTQAEDVVDETKQERGLANAAPAKKTPTKKNGNFDKVQNAAETKGDTKPPVDLAEDRLARGDRKYGRTVQGGTK